MTDIAEKANAIKQLVDIYTTLGNEERIDLFLTFAQGSGQAVDGSEKKKSGSPRMGNRVSGIRKVLEGGPLSLRDLVPAVERHEYVPGKSQEDKEKYLATQMRKSKNIYRDYGDGTWGLRKERSPRPTLVA
jgi:hypothetical protein